MAICAGAFYGEMGEPAVLFRAMSVFHTCRDRDDIAGAQTLCRHSFFLIPAFAVYADQDLAAAGGGVMDVPVVAAAGFKGDIGDEDGFLWISQGL